MKKRLSPGKRLILFAALLLGSSYGFSQVTQPMNFLDWTGTAGSQNFFQKNLSKTDGSGNVYVCGATVNGNGDYDLLIAKYNNSGVQQWINQYAGAAGGNDFATGVWIDGSSNVYVTGSALNSSADSNDVITIKYNSSGTQQWAVLYNGGYGNDGGSDITVDGSGNVYVSGTTNTGTSTYFDGLLIKYNSSGTQQYVKTFDNNNLNDGAYRVSLLTSNRVAIACIAQATSTTYKFASVRYTATTGAFIASSVSASLSIGFKMVTGCVTDAAHNMYVTGWEYNVSTGFDYRTIKLDSALNQIWTVSFDGATHQDDQSNGIAMDGSGNVYVTGYSTGANGKDYATVKYNSSGTQQWVEYYNDPDDSDDVANAIVLDNNGLPVVTGYSFNGSSKDYHTIKYDASGTAVWSIDYNGLANKDDRAFDIACDVNNDIIVTGQTQTASLTLEYTTLKYVEKSTPLPHDTITATSSSFIYTENKGQLLGTDSIQHPEIRYYVLKGGPQVYFTDTAVSYVFAKLDSSRTVHHDTLCRVDMKFKGSNVTKIRAMDIRADYENFFFPYIPDGRSYVRNYNQLVSFNVWNNIDVEFGSNLKGMKYYFICKPGSSPSGIDLLYDGADSLSVDGSGHLIIYTKLGTIIQPKAAAWEVDGSGNFSSLAWQPSYNKVASNDIMFSSFGSYNTAHTLIIAIDWGNYTAQSTTGIDWSTFYGGGNYDQFHDIRVTSTGEVVVCGQTDSSLPSAFPTTAGVVFPSHIGGTDAVVAKFYPGGHIEWATYYGGSASDVAKGIDVDASSRILITGYTVSGDFPLQQWGGAYYQSSYGGTRDAFIAALSPNGQSKIWSTYYGGANDDIALDLRISPVNGDIYMVGAAGAGFPLDLTGVYNSSTGGGAIVRFNSLGDTLWSTRFGPAPGYVFVQNITIDAAGDPVIVGQTYTTTGFPTTVGCAQSTFGGGSFDAYITKFSGTSNGIIWSTFFGGTGNDLALSIDHSKSDVSTTYYITGWTTTGTGGSFPLLDPGNSAYYQSSYGGNTDAFVAELDLSGAIQWSSYYGGSDDEKGYSIALDADNNIFITGYTKSSNLPLPSPNLSNAYVVSTITGTQDAFVSCFQKYNRKPIWSTYYGGSLTEESDAIDCSGDTAIYIAGRATTASDFPLNQGTSTSFGNRYYDGYVNGTKGFISMLDLSDVILADVTEAPTNQFNFAVYPNPSTNTIWISADLDTKQEIMIEIFDLTGQVVRKEKIAPTINLYTQIDISSLANGAYLIRLSTENKSLTKKIIVQR